MLRNEAIAELREDYQKDTLELSDVSKNPIEQFESWFQEALKSKELEANAMTLATIGQDGFPNARIVLLKGIEDNQFIFYTNYNSQKGQELAATPKAALVFNWLSMQRQIRIQGTVEKLSPEKSTAYFQSRPKGSQIGAWTSPQSQIISDRNSLEDKKAALEKQYEKEEILPRPEHWGGFKITPIMIEFWQGRTSRLHDRITFTKVGNEWKIGRLAP
jgi:pyridoxamine 5'-phosphate oxidase